MKIKLVASSLHGLSTEPKPAAGPLASFESSNGTEIEILVVEGVFFHETDTGKYFQLGMKGVPTKWNQCGTAAAA